MTNSRYANRANTGRTWADDEEDKPASYDPLTSDGHASAQVKTPIQYSAPSPKPGLVRVAPEADGALIEVEVWELDAAAFGAFVDAIPSPLTIGRVLLADGSHVAGYLCEPIAVEGAPDITSYGGWRAYLAAD